MKTTFSFIAALLLFGMVGGANATSYTLSHIHDGDNIHGTNGTAFTVSGTSTATSASIFDSATLQVQVDYNTTTNFQAWFDSARALGYVENATSNTPVGGTLFDRSLLFMTFTDLKYFGSDNNGTTNHWYDNSLLMGISNLQNCTVGMDSECLTVNYHNPAPVPEPGTMMLLGAGFLGLAVYGKRRKNA